VRPGSGLREVILRYKKGMTQSITERAGMINSALLWI